MIRNELIDEANLSMIMSFWKHGFKEIRESKTKVEQLEAINDDLRYK